MAFKGSSRVFKRDRDGEASFGRKPSWQIVLGVAVTAASFATACGGSKSAPATIGSSSTTGSPAKQGTTLPTRFSLVDGTPSETIYAVDVYGAAASGGAAVLAGYVAQEGHVYGRVEESGSHEAAIWRTENGTSWTRVAKSALASSGEIHDVIVSHGAFIAVGTARRGGRDMTAVWRSTHRGSDWTLVNAPDLNSPGAILSVAASGKRLVASGLRGDSYHAATWISTDGGSSWHLAPNLPGGAAYAVAAVEHGFVAGGPADDRSAAFWVSPDGRTWKRSSALERASTDYVESIAAHGNTLVAVGLDSAWVSSDGGTTWRTTKPPATTARPAAVFLCVRAVGGGFVIAGHVQSSTSDGFRTNERDSPMAWTSLDGVSWRSIELPSKTDQEGGQAVLDFRHSIYVGGVRSSRSSQPLVVWRAK